MRRGGVAADGVYPSNSYRPNDRINERGSKGLSTRNGGERGIASCMMQDGRIGQGNARPRCRSCRDGAKAPASDHSRHLCTTAQQQRKWARYSLLLTRIQRRPNQKQRSFDQSWAMRGRQFKAGHAQRYWRCWLVQGSVC